MEAPIIFYSWQSDSSSANNRNFIGSRLDSIAKRASAKLGLPDGLIIDRDTKGVPGSPDIAATIFDKIESSAVFVADVTFVGESFTKPREQPTAPAPAQPTAAVAVPACEPTKPKKLPNPNVMVELGYALNSLGPERLVLVMNTAYGPVEDQVFDLKSRRFPVEYHLDDKSDRAAVKVAFEGKLLNRIANALNSSHTAAARALRRLNEDCLRLIEATKALQAFPDKTAAECGLGDFRATISRLLDLELIFTDVNPETKCYSYHWTYIGELVKAAVLHRR
jgi:hypothetical protein